MCSNPAECTVEADALIVDHTEQYVTLTQVMTLMEQHNSTRALGYILFPDGIDFKEKGSFYDGNLYFDRSKDNYMGVENPVLFYDKNNWFTNAIYPWEEYKKFFEKTLIIKNGKAYRYEIVKRTHGVLFYSITEDGDYTKEYPAPSYQLLRFEEYYEVRSFRPTDLVFGKNFDNFKWVTCFIPRAIFAKTLAFALGVGQGDFNRKTISERLCDTFMRTVNPATSAITTFDRQLMPYEIEVATDAIWTQAYLERRRNSEVLARQKYINDYYGNVGLNFDTVKKIVKQTLTQFNPMNLLSDYFSGVAEELYLDKWTEFLPHSILHGRSRLIQGEMTIMHYEDELKHLSGGVSFYPKWYVALKAVFKKKPENYKNLVDSILKKVTTKFSTTQTTSRFQSLLRDVTVEEDVVDEIRFFTEEVVAIHDEPGFTEGDREALLNRLNVATDAHEPLLRNVVVSQEVQLGELYTEPVTFHPLVPLKDVVTSVKIATGYLERDVCPLLSTKYDFYEVHYNDLNMSIEADVVFNTFRRKFIAPSSILAYPKVTSSITKVKNPPSYKNTLLAFNKRNWNVPILEDVSEQLYKVLDTVDNMFDCLCVPGWRKILENEFQVYEITNFFDKNSSYVNQLIPGKAKRFNLNEIVPYSLWMKDRFKKHTNMLKAETKFSLQGEIENEYAVNATINFHDLEVNAISSSIFRNIIARLKTILRPEVCMMIEKDRKLIEEFFFRNFEKQNARTDGTGDYLSLEIDYSKFDKSQLNRCVMIEMFIYARLGLNEHFGDTWFKSLEDMTTVNYHDLIKCHVRWQRRTGTATTALGSTLITMATVCAALFPHYGRDKIDGPFHAASFLGDDSSIIVNSKKILPSEITEKLNTWFNLSAKFDIRDHIYFCSSFIIYIPKVGCKMIPDPKKRVLNLTKPIDTDPHEVFISLRDSCIAYLEDSRFIYILAQGVAQRYHLDFEQAVFVCKTITTVLSSYENYVSLYNFDINTCYG